MEAELHPVSVGHMSMAAEMEQPLRVNYHVICGVLSRILLWISISVLAVEFFTIIMQVLSPSTFHVLLVYSQTYSKP